MLELRTIRSIDDPVLAPYRSMKMQAEHNRQRIFVAEGEKVVRRLLESALVVESVCLPDKWVAQIGPLMQARPERIAAYVTPKEELEKLTGFSMYQGVLAVGHVPESANLESLCDTISRPALLAAVDGINNSENLGVLVRNAVAFGIQALLVGETSSSPYMRRAVRSSMGTVFQLPIVECARLESDLKWLRSRGICCLAAEAQPGNGTIHKADFTRDSCMVFGSEGFGLRPEVSKACDGSVSIPMQPGVDSLNVGSAAGIFFFEAQKQRRKY